MFSSKPKFSQGKPPFCYFSLICSKSHNTFFFVGKDFPFVQIQPNLTHGLVHESIVIHRQQLQVLQLSCQGTFLVMLILLPISDKLCPILVMPNLPNFQTDQETNCWITLDHHDHPVLWPHRDRVNDGTPLPRCPPHPDLRSSQEEATDHREERDLKFNAPILNVS